MAVWEDNTAVPNVYYPNRFRRPKEKRYMRGESESIKHTNEGARGDINSEPVI